MESLGELPGGEYRGEARGVSADGSVVVGWSDTDDGHRAFIWDAENGMRDLKSVLEGSFCLDLTGWRLAEASDISDDGRTIVGWGVSPEEHCEAWVASLGAPRPGDLTGDGDVDEADLAVLLAHYGTPSCAAPKHGDFDLDGDVDLDDLSALLAVYGTVCE
jgi:probable HAF family extracellular repeat protein